MDIFRTLGSGSLSVTATLHFSGKANISIHGLGEDDTASACSGACVPAVRVYACSDHCLASPANSNGRVEANVLSHVTFMPVLLRPVNNFLGQVKGNASEGKYNTVNNSSSG